MASEHAPITFANYSLGRHDKSAIYAIGAYDEHLGVIPEIAAAFGYKLTPQPDVENLGNLITHVAPAKTLQDNIDRVQAVLGTNASEIARGWTERSGLLVPVERSYTSGEPIHEPIRAMFMSGGVRNWMWRRLERMKQLHRTHGIPVAVLAAGGRKMKAAEGPDVGPDMRESDYMREVVATELQSIGVTAHVVMEVSDEGNKVMQAGARKLRQEVGGLAVRLAIVSNAGAWVQQAGQLRRALRQPEALGENFDQWGRQLFVVSDTIALGTGKEPTSTHQNPFTALGQLLRNARELLRQYG